MKAQGQEHYNFALGHCSLVLEHYKLAGVMVQGHCSLVQAHCNLGLQGRYSLVLERYTLVEELQGDCSLVQGQRLGQCSLVKGQCNLVLETLQGHYSLVLERYSLVLVQNNLVTEMMLERYSLEMVHYNLVMALGLEVHCNLELVVPQELGSLVQELGSLVLELGSSVQELGNLVEVLEQGDYNLVLVLRQEHCSSVLEGSYNSMQVVPVENRIGLVRGCNLGLVWERCSLVQVEHYNLEQVAHCNWELELGLEHYSSVQEGHCNLE